METEKDGSRMEVFSQGEVGWDSLGVCLSK